MTTKVIQIGDIICFYDRNTCETIEYTVNDICMYLTDSGTYEIGFFVNEQEEPIPYFMFKELNDLAVMWKKGSEEMMKVLRESRQSRLLKTKNEDKFA